MMLEKKVWGVELCVQKGKVIVFAGNTMTVVLGLWTL